MRDDATSVKGTYANRIVVNVPKTDLINEKNTPLKGRRSASCGSNDISPSFGQEISELNANSFKSDQASIADWVELFDKNEFQIDGGEPDENLFRQINSEQLQANPAELVEIEEDSRHVELNQAFIMEHSLMNIQGPCLLDEVKVNDCYQFPNIGSFSITAMLNKNAP